MHGLMMEAQGVTRNFAFGRTPIPDGQKCLDFNLASYNGQFRVLQATRSSLRFERGDEEGNFFILERPILTPLLSAQ